MCTFLDILKKRSFDLANIVKYFLDVGSEHENELKEVSMKSTCFRVEDPAPSPAAAACVWPSVHPASSGQV